MAHSPRRLVAGCALFWAALTGLLLLDPEPDHPQLPQGIELAPIPVSPAGLTNPESCRECHEREYQGWQHSGHAAAATASLFRVGMALEPSRWCLQCHDPERPRDDRTRPVAGVTCQSCHARAGGIATSRPPSEQHVSPHALVHDPDLAGGKSCARCHQSDFPAQPAVNQDTYGEWERAGGEKAGRCVECHLSGHEFRGAHDAGLLARAVPISARFIDGALEITVGPVAAGHMVPTGDPFRMLEVAWEVRDRDAGRAIARGERTFARRIRPALMPAGETVVDGRDDRIAPGAVVTWRIALPPGERAGRHATVKGTLRLLPAAMAPRELPARDAATPFVTLDVLANVE